MRRDVSKRFKLFAEKFACHKNKLNISSFFQKVRNT